ncbi:MAG: MlaD family protein [Deltaproteobacteria bacterium]|nr:MlaD family protein [Deltaproteobacteria bacterium]
MKDSRRYETIVGIFVVVSMVVLLIMVFIIAKQEGLFQHYLEYTTVFKNVSGLKVGSEVHLAGVTVGNVKEIIISPDGSTLVTFNVIKKYSDRVREDSQASIGFMGLLGDKSLDLTAGSTTKPQIPPEGPVASVEPLDITQLLAKAGPSLESLQKILDNLATLTQSLVGKEGGLSSTVDQIQQIFEKINQGRGTMGLIVNDPKLYRETIDTVAAARKFFADLEKGKGALGTITNDLKFKAQLEKTMGNLEATTGNLGKGTADLQEALVRLPEISKKLEDFLTDLKKAGKGLPGLVTSGETTFSDMDKTTKAMRKSWLLRSNVPQSQEHTIRMDGEAGKK